VTAGIALAAVTATSGWGISFEWERIVSLSGYESVGPRRVGSDAAQVDTAALAGSDTGSRSQVRHSFNHFCGGGVGVEAAQAPRVQGRNRHVRNERVQRTFVGFAVAEEVLVEFLSGAQTGVYDVDGLAGFCDQAPCYIRYSHWGTHVEHERLSGPAYSSRLDHEPAGFFYGHEIPRDLRVSDSYRSSLGDLVLEGA
jgi:hypothetical protein